MARFGARKLPTQQGSTHPNPPETAMKHPQLRVPLIVTVLGTAMTTAAAATPALTPIASVPEAAVAAMPRWTFDGAIHNNSLAISPDEAIAVASYSERPDVIVY